MQMRCSNAGPLFDFDRIVDSGPGLEISDSADVTLYSLDGIEASLSRVKEYSDRETTERAQALLKRMRDLGPRRRLLYVSDDLSLEQLGCRHPNFAEVVDALADEAALARASYDPQPPRPKLLVGPPGVGKSAFVEALAALTSRDFERISMGHSQTSSLLVGSEVYWSNHKSGRVFDRLVNGTHADPVFLLDEIDKIHGGRDLSPEKALYDLLEPGTSRTFRDLSLPDVSIDASHIVWIATANSLHDIDDALLSRFRVFEIPALTRDQARSVARRIFSEAASKLKLARMTVSDDALELLVDRSPRRIKADVTAALGRLVRFHRTEITPADIPRVKSAPTRQAGFR